MKTSVLLSVLTASGLISLTVAAPAQAQSTCVVNRYNQVVCRDRDNYRYDYRYNNQRPLRTRVETRQDVRDVYRDVLGREAERGGLGNWSRQVTRGGDSLQDVREGIANSQEAQNQINQIYQDVLGRDVDASGLETWRESLEDGESINDVRRAIERSEEARNKNL